MLEELDRLDAEALADDGKVQLVIFDVGLTDDPQQRLELLMQKSLNYVRHALGKKFAAQHEGKSIADVEVAVICKTPPTEEMLRFTSVTIPNLDVTVPVRFQHVSTAD